MPLFPQTGGVLTETVKNFAKREKCIAGICDASPLPYAYERFTPFVSRDRTKRTNPAANMPGVKSIVVVGVEVEAEDFPPMPEDAGVISALGVTSDYHVTVKALLKRLAEELRQHTNLTCKTLVDSPTLDERALAVRAGLGFIGRSGLVISPEYGSQFNIGLLLTDIPLTQKTDSTNNNPAQAVKASLTEVDIASKCPSNCRKCIDACPNGALSNSGGLDARRCISYLTQKDDLTAEEAATIGHHLYGCDICQDVCPFNRPQPAAWAKPKDWLAMSDADFAGAYTHTAMLWRGAALLRRNANAIISNRNTSKDEGQ